MRSLRRLRRRAWRSLVSGRRRTLSAIKKPPTSPTPFPSFGLPGTVSVQRDGANALDRCTSRWGASCFGTKRLECVCWVFVYSMLLLYQDRIAMSHRRRNSDRVPVRSGWYRDSRRRNVPWHTPTCCLSGVSTQSALGLYPNEAQSLHPGGLWPRDHSVYA